MESLQLQSGRGRKTFQQQIEVSKRANGDVDELRRILESDLNKGARSIDDLLASLKNKVPAERWDAFVIDFGEDASLLSRFDEAPGLIDSWNILKKYGLKADAERLSALLDDITELPNFAEAVVRNEGLVEAWKVLDYAGETTLRKSITELENVAAHLDEIKAAGGYKTWKLAKGGAKSFDDIVAAMKADFPSTWKFSKVGDDAFKVFDGVGNKWGTVYSDKIVAPARTAVGTPGNPILNKVPLAKSIKYDVYGLIYETDDLGRVLETKCGLRRCNESSLR